MGYDAISSNLLRLRLEKKWSQEHIAGAAGLSTLAYRNLESGKSIPKASTLQFLANAFGVQIQELVTAVPELRYVRFRSLKRLNTRGQILNEMARKLKDFHEIEGLLNSHVKYGLEDFSAKRSGSSEARAKKAAREVRHIFGLNDAEPVRDICGLLESEGVKIIPMNIASDAFFGLSVAKDNGGPAIAVNTWERISVERWIFTAAHELGHLVLHLGSFDVNQTQEETQQESEANIFGSYFLMPEKSFDKEWQDTYGLSLVQRVLKVKRIFRVSYRTVLYRVAQTNGDKVWRIFQANYKQLYGRTLLKEDEPDALGSDAWDAGYPEGTRAGEPENLSPVDFEEDRLSGLVRKAIEKERITINRGAEILGLSLSEMRALSASWID
jgi:Zn-dependent peptidase ImmA (M78 family)/DNA-binding XRE family transcriptional regulator